MHTRILIAGEKNLPQDIISSYLQNQGEYTLTVVENDQNLSRTILAHDPEILIVDMLDPDTARLSSILWLRRTFPGLLIIALFMYPDKYILSELFKTGVLGYMLYKDISELKSAIKTVYNHNLFLSRSILNIIVEEYEHQNDESHNGYTIEPESLEYLNHYLLLDDNTKLHNGTLNGHHYSDELDKIVHKWLLYSMVNPSD